MRWPAARFDALGAFGHVPTTVTASLWMGCGASTRRPRQPPDLEPERAPPPESPSKIDETAAAADQGDQLPSPRPKAAGPGDGATVQDDWDDWDEEEADEATAEEAEVSAVRVVQPSGAVACAKGGGSAHCDQHVTRRFFASDPAVVRIEGEVRNLDAGMVKYTCGRKQKDEKSQCVVVVGRGCENQGFGDESAE